MIRINTSYACCERAQTNLSTGPDWLDFMIIKKLDTFQERLLFTSLCIEDIFLTVRHYIRRHHYHTSSVGYITRRQ